MKLPAHAPRRRLVNLLPKDPFESSLLGIVLTWALTFGKWAVIVTQLIVTGVFLFRFGYDRKLTDLRKQIAKQSALIASYQQIEQDFRLTQKKVAYVKPLLQTNNTMTAVLSRLERYTPPDVWFDRISLSATGADMAVFANSLPGFSTLIQNMQNDRFFRSVSIGTLQDGGKEKARLQFNLNLQYGVEKK
jgi:Tfp pilus assembly protein PilN